jgi:hypothetical protein
MVILGVVLAAIVAAGTVAAGTISTVRWIYSRGRRAGQEEAYKARVAADLEDLKKRLSQE